MTIRSHDASGALLKTVPVNLWAMFHDVIAGSGRPEAKPMLGGVCWDCASEREPS